MSAVQGCNFPEDLKYHIEHNIWLREIAHGVLEIGMTSYALALSGQLVYYTPKKTGKTVRRDKSCATVESGKWVGPVKSPVAGEIVGSNDLLRDDPGLVNRDPYGMGWLIRLQPDHWPDESIVLLSGEKARQAFFEKMEYEGFEGCL